MFASDCAFYVLVSLIRDGPANLLELSRRVTWQTPDQIESTLRANVEEGYVTCDKHGIWSITEAGNTYFEVEQPCE